MVVRDAEEPRPEGHPLNPLPGGVRGRLPLEPVDRSQHLEEDLFRKVFRIRLIAYPRQAVAIQPGQIRVIQEPKGFLVSATGAIHVIAFHGGRQTV